MTSYESQLYVITYIVYSEGNSNLKKYETKQHVSPYSMNVLLNNFYSFKAAAKTDRVSSNAVAGRVVASSDDGKVSLVFGLPMLESNIMTVQFSLSVE